MSSFFNRMLDSLFRTRLSRKAKRDRNRNRSIEDDVDVTLADPTLDVTVTTTEDIPTPLPSDTSRTPEHTTKSIECESNGLKDNNNNKQPQAKRIIKKPLLETENTEFEKVNVKMRPAISRKSSKSEDRKRDGRNLRRLMTGQAHRNRKSARSLKDGETTPVHTDTPTKSQTEKDQGSAESDEENNTKTACHVPFVDMKFDAEEDSQQ